MSFNRTDMILHHIRLSGGDKRDRTADLLNAIQALSQLSYTPECLDILSQNKWIVKDFFIFFLTKCKRIPFLHLLRIYFVIMNSFIIIINIR